MTDIDKLLHVMARLRAPGGCPWDREQTAESLKPMLIEEAYEVLHALDGDDPADLRDELGDLLLQIVFHAQIAQEQGRFDMQGVIDAIQAKIIRRHPHVFGDVRVDSAAEVLQNWDRIKTRELADKNQTRDSLLAGISPGLPALYEAYQLGVRAARAGFDWEDAHGVLAKIREELVELEAGLAAGDAEVLKAELGDIFFAVVNLCRFLNLDPETSLKKTNRKFIERFRYIERRLGESGRNIRDCSLAELEEIWQEAKQWAN